MGVDRININRFKLLSLDVPLTCYIQNFIIYEINMDYYMQIWYDNIKEEIDKNKYLIMLGLDDKELNKMKTKDNIISKFKTSLEKVNKNPQFIEYMTKEKDDMMKQNTLISKAEEAGITQGINQSKLEIAKNLLSNNVDINIVSNSTGLSIEEINKLKK